MKKLFFCGLVSALSAFAQGQSVIALDTITNTTVEPFSQVCYQETYRIRKILKDHSYQSTGFLIAPNVVLTAAHNLYSTKKSKVANIKIFPGRYKNKYAYDTIEISGEALCQYAIKVHPDFSWGEADFDFGIIIIPDVLIKKAKSWPKASCFKLDPNYTLKKNDTISVAGFPASHGYDGSLMTYESQRCGTLNAKTFAHDFDTQTGNSGSPIWVDTKDGRKIVGVHTYAVKGTKIDSAYIKLILDWIEQHKKLPKP